MFPAPTSRPSRSNRFEDRAADADEVLVLTTLDAAAVGSAIVLLLPLPELLLVKGAASFGKFLGRVFLGTSFLHLPGGVFTPLNLYALGFFVQGILSWYLTPGIWTFLKCLSASRVL